MYYLFIRPGNGNINIGRRPGSASALIFYGFRDKYTLIGAATIGILTAFFSMLVLRNVRVKNDYLLALIITATFIASILLTFIAMMLMKMIHEADGVFLRMVSEPVILQSLLYFIVTLLFVPIFRKFTGRASK
jgi:hypothetical protein